MPISRIMTDGRAEIRDAVVSKLEAERCVLRPVNAERPIKPRGLRGANLVSRATESPGIYFTRMLSPAKLYHT